MPASVHSPADATRKPNEAADHVILHYKAINAELEAQLAVDEGRKCTVRRT
jgi:hypothetical protein